MIKKAHFKADFVDVRIRKYGFYRELLMDVEFYSAVTNKTYIVPKGFLTDLGSIPPSLQWLIPKDGLSVLPYIAHDWLYKVGILTREESDNMLEELQEAQGVGSFIQSSVRFGLWFGGGEAWDEHRAND